MLDGFDKGSGPARCWPASADLQRDLVRLAGREADGTVNFAGLLGVDTDLVTSMAIAPPGRGPLRAGRQRICVSEVADATNKNFEFVEVFVE